MKKIIFTIVALCYMTVATAQTKKLVAYFSGTGTTQRVAQEIQRLTGADILRMQPSEPYSSNPYDDSERIQNEAYNNLRPGVANLPDNLDDYDVIFVGSPIWWHYPAMVVCTFLESYDLTGKTVVPFFTYAATTYFQQSVNKIIEVTPNSNHLTAFGSTGSTSRVESWLNEIGQIGETNAINSLSNGGENFNLRRSEDGVILNIANGSTVDVFNMQGTLLRHIDNGGSYSLALPSRSVYLFRVSDGRTGHNVTKKIAL